ncbi:MAG: cupredoxin domain-containing protein [Candidatus Limnocylindrales bacterium]
MLAALIVASLLEGCSPAATPSGGGGESPAASPGSPAPSATAGPTSSTIPATAAPADSTRVELAGPPPHFEPSDLKATAGEVAFFLDNTSQGFHTLSIGPALRESVVTSTTVARGQSAIFAVRGLQPGHYIIWCTISDHVALGMVGTLVVQ